MERPDSKTVPALIDENASKRPDRLAIIDDARRVTYAELRRDVRQMAKRLYQLGVRKNDKVAILMGNQLEWVVVHFAINTLGAVMVAVNTWWRRSELQHALALADVSVLVMEGDFGKIDYTGELAAIGDLKAAFPLMRHVVCMGDNRLPGAMSWQDFMATGTDVPDDVIEAAARAVTPDDVAEILFTSGSTGRSKAVQLVHRGLIENPHAIGERMHITEQDRVLLSSSLFWSLASCNALFNVATHGACLVIFKRYSPADVLRLIEQERCTAAYTTINMVGAIYNHPDRHTRDLSSLRTGNCRGEVIDMLVEMGALEYVTTYGLTECYGQACVSDASAPLDQRRRTGGFPLPHVELQIVDPATRAKLPAGSIGEVRLRGHVMKGYYKDPEQTAKTIDADGWLYTGDLGVLDDDGFRFQGRIKEMIKTGGINVTPIEVENLLYLHDGVQQALVAGLPDVARGEIVAAMVVPKPGVTLTAEELVQHCRRNAAVYKAPRHIEVVGAEDVPLTDTGKVSRMKVQQFLANGYQRVGAA